MSYIVLLGISFLLKASFVVLTHSPPSFLSSPTRMTFKIKRKKPLKKYKDGNYAVQSYSRFPTGSPIVIGFGTPLLRFHRNGDVYPLGSQCSYDEPMKDGLVAKFTFRFIKHSVLLPDGTFVFTDGFTLRTLCQDDEGLLVVKTIAGCDRESGYRDGKALEARFQHLGPLAYNPVNGSIIIADEYRIRELSKKGIVSTLAGTGNKRNASYFALADDFDEVMTASECSFCVINGLGVLSNGTILVGDSEKLRQISVDGKVSTIANFKRHIEGIVVDGDDNIYTCVVRFDNEDEDCYEDYDPKTTTAVVKVNAVTKEVVEIVPFGGKISCGRMLSLTHEGHLMVADSSGIVHIVKTSCRLVIYKRQSKRLLALKEKSIARSRILQAAYDDEALLNAEKEPPKKKAKKSGV